MQEYAAFLGRLLQPDLSNRYTAAEALMDPWILGTDWTPEYPLVQRHDVHLPVHKSSAV